MSGPGFKIGKQQAGRDINNYTVAGNMIVNNNSPTRDILHIVEAIQGKIGQLDIPEKEKKKAINEIEGAKIELSDEHPDKTTIAEKLRKTNEILTETKTSGQTLVEIGEFVAKVVPWLGVAAKATGLI